MGLRVKHRTHLIFPELKGFILGQSVFWADRTLIRACEYFAFSDVFTTKNERLTMLLVSSFFVRSYLAFPRALSVTRIMLSVAAIEVVLVPGSRLTGGAL